MKQKSLDCPFGWICTKNECALFWAKTHPPSKSRGNPFSSFCVILLTNQQTSQQTDALR